MTGVDALQALREGKKITNLDMKGHHYACVLKCNYKGNLLTRIAWLEDHRTDEELEYAWEFSDNFNGSDFLKDDWEVVE